MYLLRRTAARAFSSAPTKAILVKPRSITTVTPVSFRSRQQQWVIPALQRRFASDEVIKTTSAAETAATEAENFAQTAAEAPVEENLTPAQEAAQTPPIDAFATVGADGPEAVAQKPPRPGRSDQTAAEPNNTLYVGNLYYEVTEDQLKRVFSRFGEIAFVKIIYDHRGLSRGFGYVQFKDLDNAQAAIKSLDMQIFEGRNLVVQFHRPRKTEHNKAGQSAAAFKPSKTLFIGNMSFEMSDKDLNDLFRDIRNVTDVRVAIDRRSGQPRGFAHADFIDIASATRARDVLREKTIYGRQLRVDYGRPVTTQPKNRREQDTVQGS